MTLTITHSTVATLPDEPGAEVNKAEWNANHTVSGDTSGLSEATQTITTSTNLTAADTNTVFFNTGSASLVPVGLPVAVEGLKFTFLLTDSSGFELTADGADSIQIGGSSGTVMTCTQLGGALVLYGYTGGWIASSSQRTWIES